MDKLQKLWIALLVLSGIIASWFLGRGVSAWWDFASLNVQIPAQILSWEVKEVKTSEYVLLAHYRYSVDGQDYIGRTQFRSNMYLNPYSAEHQVKHWKDKNWVVWCSKKSPELSSLERSLPKKESLEVILTTGVFCYFFFARRFFWQFKILQKAAQKFS